MAIAGKVEHFLIQKHLFVEQLQPDIVLFEDPSVLNYTLCQISLFMQVTPLRLHSLPYMNTLAQL